MRASMRVRGEVDRRWRRGIDHHARHGHTYTDTWPPPRRPSHPRAIDFTSEFHADCDADTLEITEFMML